jgi:hypothetical protein
VEGDSIMVSSDASLSFLNEAYKCRPADLNVLLEKIETAIKNSDSADNLLFRAKTIVTSKLALQNE